MQHSRSESALGAGNNKRHSGGNGAAGVRLAPVGARPGVGVGGAGGAWPAEEKQSHAASPHRVLGHSSSIGGLGTRVVDASGRPRDGPDPLLALAPRTSGQTPPPIPRVDADGLPVISILSPAGLRGNQGDMSALLRQRVVRTSTPDLAALAAPKGTSPKHAKMRSGGVGGFGFGGSGGKGKAGGGMGAGAVGMQRTTSLASGGSGIDARGHGRSGSHDFESGGGPRPRVTDFSTDGGMGGANQGARQSMEAPPAPDLAALLGGGSGAAGSSPSRHGQHGGAKGADLGTAPPALSGAPPHLANLSRDVAGANAALQAQLRGLDLLSTAFGQLIGEVSGSKGNLARLLTRVQHNYKLLFGNLADSILSLQSQYHTALRACVSDYKSLQLRMDGKVAHLEQRVRLLSSVSVSKDAMIAMHEGAAHVLEAEMADLKANVVAGMRQVPLKVEQAGHAIIAQSSLAQKARARGREKDRARQLSLTDPQFAEVVRDASPAPSPTAAGGGGGGAASSRVAAGAGTGPDVVLTTSTRSSAPESANFENATSTDALEQLSLESRNLTYELAELIQNVEAQSEKSAAALAHLDSLLERGATEVGVEALAKDAALNVAMTGGSVAAGSGPGAGGVAGLSFDLDGDAAHASASRGAAHLPMAVEGSLELGLGLGLGPSPMLHPGSAALQHQGLLTPPRAASASPGVMSPLTPSSPTFGPSSHLRGAGGQGWSLEGGSGGGAAALPSYALGSRPSSAELRSSSRWQYLRHMTEKTAVEQKWSSATQTDESLSGYCTVLHLEPMSLAQQAAAAANEARLPLHHVSSVPLGQPEEARDAQEAQEEAERTKLHATAPLQASSHSVGTDAPDASALDPSAATATAAPVAPAPPQPLRPFPLRINGFVLPGSLCDFLAPVFGLGGVDDPDYWAGEEEPWGVVGTARSLDPARSHRDQLPPPSQRLVHVDTGRSAYPTPTAAAGRGDTGRLVSAATTHRRNGSDFITILGPAGNVTAPTPPFTPRSAALGTPVAASGGGSHGPPQALRLTRRDSLSGVAPLSLPMAASGAPAASQSTTLIGHNLDPRALPDTPKELHSPLLFQPLGTERRMQQQAAGAHGLVKRDSVSASPTPRSHRAGAHSLDQSPTRVDTSGGGGGGSGPSFSYASASPSPSGAAFSGGFATAAATPVASGPSASSVSFAGHNPPPLIIPPRAAPFREPTTADQLNPARHADANRFALGSPSAAAAAASSRKDASGAVRDLPLSLLAQLGPPLSAQQVFDSILALYARYVSVNSFSAVTAVVATVDSTNGGRSGTGTGLSSLLVDHALEQSGSVSSAPAFLGALLAGLMALYARSELVRHFCHFAGLVHGNAATGPGAADAADYRAAEGLDMYARAVTYFVSGKSARADPAHHPFDYEGGAISMGGGGGGGGGQAAAPAPALSYISTQSAELFATEVLSPLCIRLPGVREVAQRCGAWLAANARAPHAQLPPHRQVSHVGLAAFAMRAAREWRSHVRNVVLLAGRSAVPRPVEWRGDAELRLDQWRSFLRGVCAAHADALLAAQPHLPARMLQAFARHNRRNAQGDMVHVYAGLLPLLRQAGMLAIHTRQTTHRAHSSGSSVSSGSSSAVQGPCSAGPPGRECPCTRSHGRQVSLTCVHFCFCLSVAACVRACRASHVTVSSRAPCRPHSRRSLHSPPPLPPSAHPHASIPPRSHYDQDIVTNISRSGATHKYSHSHLNLLHRHLSFDLSLLRMHARVCLPSALHRADQGQE